MGHLVVPELPRCSLYFCDRFTGKVYSGILKANEPSLYANTDFLWFLLKKYLTPLIDMCYEEPMLFMQCISALFALKSFLVSWFR